MYLETATQFSENNRDLCDIVIGFDFGTSCTKMVLQSPYAFNRNTIPVIFFPQEAGVNRYLLPSLMYCNTRTGEVCLQKSDGFGLISHLKILCLKISKSKCLFQLKDGDEITIQEVVVAYIAKALQLSRCWFLEMCGNLYGNKKIMWRLNLGIPSGRFNHSHIADFLCLVKLAWWFSVNREKILLQEINQKLRSNTPEDFQAIDQEVEIHIVPEIAAEIVGYARSNLRSDGLHVLIDIGASTVDIAGFNLYKKDGSDVYSLLRTDVQLLGSFILHQQRVRLIKKSTQEVLRKKINDPDLVKPIPENIREYLPETDLIKDADLMVAAHFEKMVKSAILALRNEKDPNALAWEKGLPVFVCGGGKNIKLYLDLLHKVRGDLVYFQKVKKIDLLELPAPEYFKGDSYDRLAVAHGLSHLYDDIGTIRGSQQIRRIQKAISKRYDECTYINKEMV